MRMSQRQNAASNRRALIDGGRQQEGLHSKCGHDRLVVAAQQWKGKVRETPKQSQVKVKADLVDMDSTEFMESCFTGYVAIDFHRTRSHHAGVRWGCEGRERQRRVETTLHCLIAADRLTLYWTPLRL